MILVGGVCLGVVWSGCGVWSGGVGEGRRGVVCGGGDGAYSGRRVRIVKIVIWRRI